jgi:hypothetical protein
MAQQRRTELALFGKRIEGRKWGICSRQKKLEKEIRGERLCTNICALFFLSDNRLS